MATKAKELYSRKETYTIPGYVVAALNNYSEETIMPKSRVVQLALVEYLKIEKPKRKQATQE